MARTRSVIVLGTLALSAVAGASFAQECDTNRTLGTLINKPGAQTGYTLIDGRNSNDIYLVDNEGRIVNEWLSEYPAGNMAYLLEDGSLLRAADPGPLNDTEIIQFGDGGLIERFDWDGELIWSFVYNDPEARQHHDIEPMPNGNVLILAWEYHPIEEVWARGRDPKTVGWNTETTPFMLSERILEVDTKTNEVLWIWSSWDRHIQNRYPDLPNYGEPQRPPRQARLQLPHVQPERLDPRECDRLQPGARSDPDLVPAVRRDLDHQPTKQHRRGKGSGRGSHLSLGQSRRLRTW